MSNIYPVFIVICADDCCQDCANTYLGKVFSTENDSNMNPPLHEGCKCAIAYFETKEIGKIAAQIIEDERKNKQNTTQKKMID